jgi:1,2-diacylglycerol 3-alpha-glucosyltransferase
MTRRVSRPIAVLFRSLGPYHCARIAAAARVLPVVAVEFSASDSSYAWTKFDANQAFERRTVFSGGDADSLPLVEYNRRLVAILDELRPGVLALPGWGDRGALLALRWADRTGTPAIVMSESQASDTDRVVWKEWIKRSLLRTCVAAVVGGDRHAEYVAELGIPRSAVFGGYDAVDNDYFAQRVARIREDAAQERGRLGLPKRFFLASSRFIPKKNLPTLLRAYATYRERRGAASFGLVLLGDGPMRSELVSLINELELQSSVLLPGFKQYEELPSYYGLADAFVHASLREQWGLVVNEAMASALPVLVSRECGCASELVVEGENGFTFDPENAHQLASLLEQISSDSVDRVAMGEASAAIVDRYSPAAFAAGLQQASVCALEAPRVRRALLDRGILSLRTQLLRPSIVE